MMLVNHDIDINEKNIHRRIKKIINQIYKLLPMREEKEDWQKPLETIFEELRGMSSLLDIDDEFFGLLCKLEGLFDLTEETDFSLYRRSIFECLSILNSIDKKI